MTRRLYRSRKDKIIAGVCGGLAEYFDIDPVIIRLLMVLLFIYGVGIIIYILAWIMIPMEPAAGEAQVDEVVVDVPDEKRKRERVGAIILIITGVVLLFGAFYSMSFIWKIIVPLTIISAGIYILLKE